MASRTFQFFMRKQEFPRAFGTWTESFGLMLVGHHRQKKQLVGFKDRGEYANALDQGFSNLALVPEQTDLSQIDSYRLSYARMGWITLAYPKEEEDRLYLSDLGIKTDWVDEVTSEIRDTTDYLEIYKDLRSKLRRQLSSPMWASDTNGDHVKCYRDLYFSKAAAEWQEEGGELRQEGVENVVFLTSSI